VEQLRSHLQSTRAFFGPRAAGWEERFPDDEPLYAAAVAELRPAQGGVVVDLGCGTGRALADLRRAVGGDGVVVGIDVTPEMLEVARAKHSDARSDLLLADATSLPLAPGSVAAIFAAGLLTHVPDPRELLRTLARVAQPGCRLALFHPVGRAVLAARHERMLAPDDLLDPSVLPDVLAGTGWVPERIDDSDDRYLAIAHVASDRRDRDVAEIAGR
jgi:SAM-dependent methyltransferase